MSDQPDAPGDVEVTAEVLRRWPLPEPGDSKHSRGRIAVVGGSERAPGAVLLAGLSALRVGAGRLSLHVPRAVAVPLAVAVPEGGVFPFDDDLTPEAVDDLSSSDAVLIGPGLTDAGTTIRLLRAVLPVLETATVIVLDAFALGVLPDLADDIRKSANPLVLTPNREEATLLLDSGDDGSAGDVGGDEGGGPTDVARIAAAYDAVVSCYGVVGSPSGQTWSIRSDNPGLATSGSGDVLAGAVVGLAARTGDAAQAAVWGTFLHTAAGDALVERVGAIGFLARQISEQLPISLDEVAARKGAS
ncbi:hypothetical protein ASF62_08780 [Leifsonia sp. Leaf325]|nr:NAD(P)H-hydrate dehydratase [Leifsonia sp. Leaf325]KQQ94223.1 hypothetical protein ASF62_08780 [Leifsonia sp. Leaf325]